MINKWLKNISPGLCQGVFCCYLCHDTTTADTLICTLCWRDILRANNTPAENNKPIENIDYSLSLSVYSFPLDKMLLSLKYRQKLLLARELAKKLAVKVRQSGRTTPDYIVPVPLHTSRLLGRGFNQSLEIARYLAQELEIPLRYREVRRQRRTAPQFKLKPGERRKNVKGAFKVTPGAISGSLVIFDDIVTTGETASELAKELKAAGAREVGLWTCARAE